MATGHPVVHHKNSICKKKIVVVVELMKWLRGKEARDKNIQERKVASRGRKRPISAKWEEKIISFLYNFNFNWTYLISPQTAVVSRFKYIITSHYPLL